MKILPKSLANQIALSVGVVLFISQIFIFGGLLFERQDVLSRAEGRIVGRRVEGILQIFNVLEAEQYETFLRAVNTPSMRVRLIAPEEQFALSVDPADDRHAQRILNLLQEQLGPKVEIRIKVSSTDQMRRDRYPNRNLRLNSSSNPSGAVPNAPSNEARRNAPRKLFVIQAGLEHGSWLQITNQSTEQPPDFWPLKLVISAVIALVSMLLVVILVLRRIVRPLGALGNAVDRFGRNLETDILEDTGAEEIRKLARAFNLMRERISRFVSERSRMLTAVSHDLKTPITRLRLRVALMQDEELQQQFEKDLDEMEMMVNETLEFMRGDSLVEASVAFDVNALIESIQQDMNLMGRNFNISGEALHPYEGKLLALKRLITNLLDNAFNYGESVRVELADSSLQLCLRVVDCGPGIPADKLELVFEPFYRFDTARQKQCGGSGLGLGIARNIAHAHGGELTLQQNKPHGVIAELILPRSSNYFGPKMRASIIEGMNTPIEECSEKLDW